MIHLKKVYKHYDKGLVKALNGISLSIKKGEICSLTGPSGCGKSTLLNLIGALDMPTYGEIYINNTLLNHTKSLAGYRSRQVGFVFQFHNLIPNITLVENVELPTFAINGMERHQRREKALELLEEVDLGSRAHFLPTQVSGGERQRAAVARALINSPEILLADEPTGSVDSATASFIMSSILTRCRNDAMTALIVTHDPNIASQADRIIHLRDGYLELSSNEPDPKRK